jgi:hypothetical protein
MLGTAGAMLKPVLGDLAVFCLLLLSLSLLFSLLMKEGLVYEKAPAVGLLLLLLLLAVLLMFFVVAAAVVVAAGAASKQALNLGRDPFLTPSLAAFFPSPPPAQSPSLPALPPLPFPPPRDSALSD